MFTIGTGVYWTQFHLDLDYSSIHFLYVLLACLDFFLVIDVRIMSDVFKDELFGI